MAPATRSSKKGIPRVGAEDKQNATPTKKPMDFETFGAMVPFLKEQILSYLDNPSLYNYGLCSKDCNEEIQKLNKMGPKEIWLSHKWLKRTVAAEVELDYRQDGDSSVTYLCDPVDRLDYGVERATETVQKAFKYVKNGRIWRIGVHLKKWPSEIMSLPQMKEARRASISIYKQDYNQFTDFLDDSQITELYLVCPRKSDFKRISAPYMFPKAFFKTRGFKKLNFLWLFMVDSEIDEEDFLNTEISLLRIQTNSIDESVMNKKIRKWFEGGTPSEFSCQVTRKNRRRFDEDLIKHGLPFDRDDKLRRSDGIVGTLTCNRNVVSFSTCYSDNN